MDCSTQVSSVHEILWARILEWVAIPISRGSFGPRDRTRVSHIAGRFFTIWATREAHDYRHLYKHNHHLYQYHHSHHHHLWYHLYSTEVKNFFLICIQILLYHQLYKLGSITQPIRALFPNLQSNDDNKKLSDEIGRVQSGMVVDERHLHPNVHRSTVYHSQDMEAT